MPCTALGLTAIDYGVAAAPALVPVFEQITLDEATPEITVTLLSPPGTPLNPRPVILTAGLLSAENVHPSLIGFLEEGYTLAGHYADYPPDPDPARRPVWIFWDARLAHAYTLLASRAGTDAGRVIDYLESRPDLDATRVGWLGLSTSGIIGLAAMTQEPRLRALVAFVATGSYREWFGTWFENGTWQGTETEIWPETEALLDAWDPILHVAGLAGRPVLLVCGEDDIYVDPRTARAFADAARPHYAAAPDHLQLVIYTATGHILPPGVIEMHTGFWFGLHLRDEPMETPSGLTFGAWKQTTELDGRGKLGSVSSHHHRGN